MGLDVAKKKAKVKASDCVAKQKRAGEWGSCFCTAMACDAKQPFQEVPVQPQAPPGRGARCSVMSLSPKSSWRRSVGVAVLSDSLLVLQLSMFFVSLLDSLCET